MHDEARMHACIHCIQLTVIDMTQIPAGQMTLDQTIMTGMKEGKWKKIRRHNKIEARDNGHP